MNSKNSGTFLVILAGVCWGFISIFIRGLNACGFDSMQIVALRAWLSMLMLLIAFLIKKPSLLKIRLKDIWMFIGTGVLSMTFFTYCYFASIVRSGAAVSVVLLYTSPVFVMLMSALVFKEKLSLRKLLALVLTFIGCALVAGLVGTGASLSAEALLLGLGAGFGYALYSIFAGLAVKKYSSLTVTFYTMLFSGLSMLFLTDFHAFAELLTANFIASWYHIIGIALICTVVPYVVYTQGLGKMEAGRAAVLVTVEPLVGALLGIAVYGEAADLFKISGIVIILAAVILLSKTEAHSS